MNRQSANDRKYTHNGSIISFTKPPKIFLNFVQIFLNFVPVLISSICVSSFLATVLRFLFNYMN